MTFRSGLSGEELAVRMADLARSIAAPSSADEVLASVTAAAVELIPGVDTAGMLLVDKGGKFESLFVTSDLVYELDGLQQKYNEGPCVDAAVDGLIVRTNDFATEHRWPNYSRAVAEIGVRSCLSVKLYTSYQTAGALNLFGTQPEAFDGESDVTATVLASHAAAAIMASRHGEQLRSALTSRDVIGQAKGVIMERFNVDAVKAFKILRELSQNSNVRLAEIAQRVVESRGD